MAELRQWYTFGITRRWLHPLLGRLSRLCGADVHVSLHARQQLRFLCFKLLIRQHAGIAQGCQLPNLLGNGSG